jgi:hypothetical protein
MKSPFATFLLNKPIQRLLLSRRRYVQSLDGVSVPQKGFGGVEWVLSRGLCRFGRFDLANIPKSQRPQAVLLQIRQWSAFPRTGSCVVIGDDAACMWIWDKDKIDQEIASAKLNRRRVEVIPEALLHTKETNAHRLVKCLDGVEGQVWQGGELTHSRWWPEPPDFGNWNAFLRDGGQPAAESVPATCSMVFSKTPWAQVSSLNDGAGGRYENLLVMVGLSLLSAMSVWFLVQTIQLSGKIDEEKERLVALEQRAKPIQEARQQALDLLERIEFLRGFDPYPAQTLLQAEIGKRLPKDGTYIKEWDFQAGKLKLTLASPNKLQASVFVKAYQEAGWFKDVQAPSGTDPNQLVLEMSVLRLVDINPELIEGKPTGPPQISSPGSPPQKNS